MKSPPTLLSCLAPIASSFSSLHRANPHKVHELLSFVTAKETSTDNPELNKRSRLMKMTGAYPPKTLNITVTSRINISKISAVRRGCNKKRGSGNLSYPLVQDRITGVTR